MRGLTVVVALLALIAGAANAQVNQEMIDRVTAGEITEARASWWGFNEEDATEALQAAINSGARKLTVENMGRPWIVSPLFLASNQEIVFEEGCEILAKRGEFKSHNDCLFVGWGVENIVLRGEGNGATFRMWKKDYDNPELYRKAQWRHCLSLRGARNIQVSGFLLTASGGDGIYIAPGTDGEPCVNIRIKEVICDNNYRQGISVISVENLLIEDTIMRNTSGQAPQAGIDFEPNDPEELLKNIVLRNCLTENNNAAGYTFYLPKLNANSEPVSVRFEDCRSVGDRGHAVRVRSASAPENAVSGTIAFADCVFEASRRPGIAISMPAGRLQTSFTNCSVENCVLESERLSPVMFESQIGCEAPIGGVEFGELVVRDPIDRLPLQFANAGGVQLQDVFGSMIIVRGDGERRYVPLTERLLSEWMPVSAIKEIPRVSLHGLELKPMTTDAGPDGVIWPWVRKQSHYLFHAEAGDEVRFTVDHQQVGNNKGQPLTVTVTGPSDNVAHEAWAPFLEQTPIGFIAPETGIYSISLDAGRNRVSLREPSHSLSISAESLVGFIDVEKDLAFYVPAGTEEFGVRIAGQSAQEAVRAILLAPNGEVYSEVDNQFAMHQFVVRPAGGEQFGVWTLQIRTPSNAGMEDHFVELRGIPPLLTPAGSNPLVPFEK